MFKTAECFQKIASMIDAHGLLTLSAEGVYKLELWSTGDGPGVWLERNFGGLPSFDAISVFACEFRTVRGW